MARRAGATAGLTFSGRNGLLVLALQRAGNEPKEISKMSSFGPFVSRLSVVTAYVAFAFVGAIVLGVF
jgi:hypothetical protein